MRKLSKTSAWAITAARPVKIGEDKITIWQGMLIPNFREKVLYSVQVRTWPEDKGYKYCKDSVPVPYHFKKLDDKKAPVIIVESTLDAALIYQEAGDLVHAVALGSAQAKPDMYLSNILYETTRIFLCLDYDDAGFDAAKWWKTQYPKAKIGYCPKGKDIGDFKLGGGSVREWVKTLVETGKFPQRPQPSILLAAILMICLIAGIAWAATIVLDGDVEDWAAINPIVADLVNDQSGDPNEDIRYGFVTNDETHIYFRVDYTGMLALY